MATAGHADVSLDCHMNQFQLRVQTCIEPVQLSESHLLISSKALKPHKAELKTKPVSQRQVRRLPAGFVEESESNNASLISAGTCTSLFTCRQPADPPNITHSNAQIFGNKPGISFEHYSFHLARTQPPTLEVEL